MQPSNDGSLLEIIDLAHALRQEQLFINNEQETFLKLNTNLLHNSESVSQLAWICSQQRKNLTNLIISKPDTGPSSCCRRANCLENTKFVPAYKAIDLKYQYVLSYTDLFNYLHRSPHILAQCLSIGDNIFRSTPDKISSVIETIANGLYDNVIHSKDVEMVLKLLQELIEIQIVDCDNPRRIFRIGSCAFSRLYHRLHESLFSAKLFLTASLFDPIMKVLIEDEILLDIDPVKAVSSFPLKERLKKFGATGTEEYELKLLKYTEETFQLLFNLANRFIKSLLLNWSLFPSTLRWLVQSLCNFLKRSQFSEKDINAILTEMIFTNFICPAVVSPDLFGIIDAPISEVARFNLIQIGQILQMLALIKYEDVDPKVEELYKKFDRNLVSDLLNQLLPTTEHGISMLAMSANPNNNNVGRTNVNVTQSELNVFVDFLRSVLDNQGIAISDDESRKLCDILDRLPDKWENMSGNDQQSNHDLANNIIGTKLLSTKTQNFLNLQKKTKSKLSKTISLNVSSLESDIDITIPTSINGNGTNNHHHDQSSNHSQLSLNYNEYEHVLAIPISVCEVETKFQLLTENEVLNMNNISNETVEPILTEKNVEELERQTEENEAIDGVVLRSGHQKSTRFSLSHDDASIGNASDNLEAQSEAPSNHSVASSMELEENYQNDNLSDMVSANVSGRGTPNISGRDTPSSQVTEGENPRPHQIPTPQMAKILSKARSDIEDKFCKFEIKKLMEGDETISIISDTWSTDVLASDSETIEANDRNFSTPLIPSSVILPGDNNFDPLSSAGTQLRSQNFDVSETQSESAWSTDVLASDSEKMTEVDTDDNQSIAAKSDITDAGRSEGDPANHGLNQAPDSPMFFAQRLQNNNFRAPQSPLFKGRRNGGTSDFPNRSFREDDYNRYVAPVSISLLHHSRDHNRSRDPLIDLSTSSIGGSIGNGESHDIHHHPSLPESNDNQSNSFLLDDFDHENYSMPHRIRSLEINAIISKRQNSIESNNSEISSNFDRDDKKLFDYRKQTKEYVDNTPIIHEFKLYDIERGNNKKNNAIQTNNNNNQYSNYDPIFHHENIIKTSTNLINPFDDSILEHEQIPVISNEQLLLQGSELSDELVEHRRLSSEQRNASFDGRRNGIIEYKSQGDSINKLSKDSNSIVNNHLNNNRAKNYENHLIMRKDHITFSEKENQADDELILVKKTSSLNLNSLNSTNAKSTGAIPKSISFDSSADKINNRNTHHHHHNNNNLNTNQYNVKRSESNRVHGSGFFNKIKQGFKTRRGHKFRSLHDIESTSHDFNLATSLASSDHNPSNNISGNLKKKLNNIKSNSKYLHQDLLNLDNNYIDSTEDILAKYRRKVSSSSDAAASDSTGSNVSSSKSNKSNSDVEQQQHSMLISSNDSSFLFNNAKRKLRIVLSSTDLQTSDFYYSCYSDTSPLLIYLQIQLAQALNLQNLKQVSYVSEIIRCINLMSSHEHQKLLDELQQDIFKRQSYIQYLIRYRQNLLTAIENLERFEYRLQNDRELLNRHLIMVCVRMFLEKRENTIFKLIEKFTTLTIVDEKIDYLEECMIQLMDELRSDGILQGMADWQLQEARTCIERILLQRLYRQVMFPNDDGDIARDQVLREHIRKLSKNITPKHPNIRIPNEYLLEAPWPFAQQQISYISAYKTPKEKVECVVRCITSIMNLLSMASNRVPAADDLTPVLIYVIIKANPPYLLSTIEYVNCFIGEKLEGETQYWWTQFCSAVTYIKTMDYGE